MLAQVLFTIHTRLLHGAGKALNVLCNLPKKAIALSHFETKRVFLVVYVNDQSSSFGFGRKTGGGMIFIICVVIFAQTLHTQFICNYTSWQHWNHTLWAKFMAVDNNDDDTITEMCVPKTYIPFFFGGISLSHSWFAEKTWTWLYWRGPSSSSLCTCFFRWLWWLIQVVEYISYMPVAIWDARLTREPK